MAVGLWLAAFLCCLASAQYGFAIGVLNVPQERITADLNIPSTSLSWATVVSIFCLGGLLGANAAGGMADKRGRCGLLAASAALCTLAGALHFIAGLLCAGDGVQTSALVVLGVGRFVIGVGTGLATVGAPLYLGEIAPRESRGLYGSLNQLAVVLGILGAQVIAAATADVVHWRVLLAIPSLIGLVQLAFGLGVLMPETPVWILSSRADVDGALASLKRLRAKSEDDLADELDAIHAEVREAKAQSNAGSSFISIVQDRTLRLPLFVSAVMMIGQQWSGINAVFYYSTGFFADAGVSDPVLGTLLASTVNALAMVGTVPLMESLGRRKLLLLGVGGMLIAALSLTAILELKDMGNLEEETRSRLNLASVICVLFFVAAFELGPGPIPWQIGSEIFPDAPRATAMGAAAVLNWVCNGLLGLAFPPMQEALGPAVFVPFCVVLATWLAITLRYVPETKGRSINEIQLEFAKLAGGDVHHLLNPVT